VRIIGVIDLMRREGRAQAVAARGGERAAYRPLRSALLGPTEHGHAGALAQAYASLADVAEIYVADLDAIEGRPANDLAAIRAAALPLLVDVGGPSPAQASQLVDALGPPVRVVIGLETLRAWSELAGIAAAIGTSRAVFSLDLRGGRPIVRADSHPALAGLSAGALAGRAIEHGAGTVILLDLGRVGTRSGIDRPLVAEIRAATVGVELLVGGGVRGLLDLDQLAALGCDGALVGSAFHDGTLGAPAVAIRGLELSQV
jgi:phosphoribosylformimino-5-aminoimidazole carboxamide ribotide isomerase